MQPCWFLFAVACCSALTVSLSNGLEMPLVGFGTAGGVRAEAVKWAYEAGVRLFDTAQAKEWYDEPSVAEGLRGVSRESYWLESKLHPRDLGFESTLKAFPNSLQALNTSYLDVFLIHFPYCSMCDTPPGTFQDSWRALEQLYSEGKVKAIGISNFDEVELKGLLRVAKVVPHVLQNHFDPLHQDHVVRQMCAERKIAYQGYSTLGTQWSLQSGENPVLSHPVILDLASVYERSPAQIILAWAVNRGVGVLPRSVKKENIEQNANIEFKMQEEDLERIDQLDPAENKPDFDPDSIQVEFVNSHAALVSLAWEGPQGLEHITSLSPGESFASRSYDGHTFVVKEKGKVKYSFDVSSSFPIYDLEATKVRRHNDL